MNCENCGRANEPGAKFCPACGIALGATAVAQAGRGAIPTRGLGGLLDESLRVYRAHFWQFVAIAAIAAAANVFGSVLSEAGESALALLGGLFILAAVVLAVITGGAIVFGVARHYARGEVDIADCLSHAFQVGIYLVVQALLVAVLVGGLLVVGTIMVIIGAIGGAFDNGAPEGAAVALMVIGGLLTLAGLVIAIWLGVRWFSAAYAVVLEGKGPIAGLGRSWNLVTGSWWRVFGLGVVIAIIVVVVAMVVAIPFGVVGAIALGEDGAGVIGAIGGALATVLITPFAYIFGTLLYFDLRVRKEGFDLDALTAETSRA